MLGPKNLLWSGDGARTEPPPVQRGDASSSVLSALHNCLGQTILGIAGDEAPFPYERVHSIWLASHGTTHAICGPEFD